MVQAKCVSQLRGNRIFPEVISRLNSIKSTIYVFFQLRNLTHLLFTDNLTSGVRFTKRESRYIHQKFHHLLLDCTTTPILVTMLMHHCNHIIVKASSYHLIMELSQTSSLDTNISILLRFLTLFTHQSHHCVSCRHLHGVLRLQLFRNCQTDTSTELEHVQNITGRKVVPNSFICCIHYFWMDIFII